MTPFSCSPIALATAATMLLATVQSPAVDAAPDTGWSQISVHRQVDPLIQGATPLSAWSRGEARCYQYPNYTVSETSTANTGSKDEARFISIITVRASKIPCKQIHKLTDNQSIFTIKKGFEFFQGLAGNVLITDSGSAPDGRILTLYNVDKRSKFLQFDDYADDPKDLAIKNNKLTLWYKTSYATKTNCRQYKQWTTQGFGAVLESQVSVDLTSHRVVDTSRRRCQPRQSRNPEQTS